MAESTLTKEQLEERKNGIGASEAAPIAGLSPFQGPLDVYLLKTGQMTIEDNEHMERGRMLESALRDWYAAKRPDYQVRAAPTVKHPDHDFIFATPDGIVADDGFDVATLELKSPQGTFDHWGEEGTDQIPEYYVPQVTQQMACKGLPRAEVGALVRGIFRIYVVEFHADLWMDLSELEHEFWHNHVLKRVPPSYEGSQMAIEWLRKRHPEANKEIITSSIEVEDAAIVLRDVQAQLKELEQKQKELKAVIMEHIGDNYGVETNLGKILHYNVKGRESTKWRDLVHKLGGTESDIDEFTSRGKGSRTFRAFWKKEDDE